MRDMRDEESDDKVINEVASLLNPAKCISSFAQTEKKLKKERKKEEQMTTEVKHEMKRLE